MSATFGVLGTVLVRHGDRAIEIPAAKQRIVLAKLLVHANEPVRVDALADAIWPGRSLPAAPVTVRNYVRRLRQVLGPVGCRILTRPPGYLVEVNPGELDAQLFAELTDRGSAAAHTGDWRLARERLGAALALWRGTPFADVPSPELQSQEAHRLDLIRTRAVERRLEADLHLGLHAELVPELERLIADHPMSERFHAQLILALYLSGLRAEALAAFQRARGILLEELGLEPGEELRELQRRILVGDPTLAAHHSGAPQPGAAAAITAREPGPPPAGRAHQGRATAPVVPRQLPYLMPHFVGRRPQLQDLQRRTDEAVSADAKALIVAVDGTAGVGKSTLAVHFAHKVAGDYPDGQMYVNLRGFDEASPPMQASDAIRQFLDALQVPARQVPATFDSQVGLYRSLLSDRRMLILLDNARDAEQVRPLLPGSVGTLVLVTSRTDLTGLAAAEGAHLVKLDVLSDDEARLLLAARLGASRVAAEPTAVTTLIELCARLPIALSVAAGFAAGRPRLSLSAQVDRLISARARLDMLATGEAATDTRAVLAWSYRSLSSGAKRMFRLLGIHPGPDISLPAAASLTAVGSSEASRLVQELVRTHMLAERLPGRFALHDLLRAYAAEQARAVDADPGIRAAQSRLLDHYLRAAHQADGLIRPSRVPLDLPPPEPGVGAEELGDHAAALAWYRSEHAVLLGAIGLAERSEPDAKAWQLPWAIAGYLDLSGHWNEWAATQRSALRVARRLGDPLAQAHARRSLGCALQALEQHDEADVQLREAQQLYHEAGDIAAQGRTCVNVAHLEYRQDRYDEALTWACQGLDCARSAGDVPGQANALNAVGMIQSRLKHHEEALAACVAALQIFRDVGLRRFEASTWDAIGTIRMQLGDFSQAAADCVHAAEIHAAFSDGYRQAESLGHAGDACQAGGRPQDAVMFWTQALAILEGLEHADADTMRAKLAAIADPAAACIYPGRR